MRIDWTTAEVITPRQSTDIRLRVRLVEVRGNAYYEVFDREAAQWSRSFGDERRSIHKYMTGGDTWGIEVWPIDPDDVEGEKRLLEDFIDRVNRAAAPEQAKLDEESQRQAAEAHAREARARDLTDRFRNG